MVDNEESLYGWPAIGRGQDRTTQQEAALFTQIKTDGGIDKGVEVKQNIGDANKHFIKSNRIINLKKQK